MNTITKRRLLRLLEDTYPQAEIYLLDAVYNVPKTAAIKSMYDKFIGSMWKVRLYDWVKNKLDCDKWARLFTAHVIIRNALGKFDNAMALGQLCYKMDKGGYHMINVAIVQDGDDMRIQEIEPQPKNGLVTLTQTERESAWLISI